MPVRKKRKKTLRITGSTIQINLTQAPYNCRYNCTTKRNSGYVCGLTSPKLLSIKKIKLGTISHPGVSVMVL